MQLLDLSGTWQGEIPGQSAPVRLPGTLDESGVGFPDRANAKWHPDADINEAMFQAGAPIATRLTRRFTYEGPAILSRSLDWTPPQGKRLFLECERTRHLSLRVNGQSVPHAVPPTISTPNVFEVTGLLTGHDHLELICDNSYPGWPRNDFLHSSAATDETQTNWNGVIGYIRIRAEEPVYIRQVRVYPKGNSADVCVTVDAAQPWQAEIAVTSDALAARASLSAGGGAGEADVWLRGLPLAENVRRWDEDEGILYDLTAQMQGHARTVRFGVRDFGKRDNRLVLNGRNIFIRSETNCAVFPETGYMPTTVEAWREVLQSYRSYGVNSVRFHSHCPPEAAFTAADEMGMLMQPELSHWSTKIAFGTPESRDYYRTELRQVLRMLANHPSFVMLSLGNELFTDEESVAFMGEMMALARELDGTRLYAVGSNNHFIRKQCHPASDFHTSMIFGELDTRATGFHMVGWLNQKYPDLRKDYAETVAEIRRQGDQATFSFEVGQYQVLPDFEEIEEFRGVTDPANIRLIRDRAAEKGLLPCWKQMVEATGELSLLCYRAEVEAALRTDRYSGILLLGLQDFPGQGTALVGMMNAHMQPKPHAFARPERFAAFFTGVLPLVLLPRMTYTAGETLRADLRMANYGKAPLQGAAAWTLSGAGMKLWGKLPERTAPAGELTALGEMIISLPGVEKAAQLELTVDFCGHVNRYDLWVYPDVQPLCPANVHQCRSLDEAACEVLARGGTVYLAPDSDEESLPGSIKAQFSTDFWSVGTFKSQGGGMGQMMDVQHPIFADFPTQAHTNWQWLPMAIQRAMILPRRMQAIVAELDSYAYLRPMAQLLECRCGGGRLMISSMGLHSLMQYPEARALQQAIYSYLSSTTAMPEQELTVGEVRAMVK